MPGWSPTGSEQAKPDQGHGNATGRVVEIDQHEEINRDAVIGILTEIVANNRRGGWRRPSHP